MSQATREVPQKEQVKEKSRFKGGVVHEAILRGFCGTSPREDFHLKNVRNKIHPIDPRCHGPWG